MSTVHLIKMAPGLRRLDELEAWLGRFGGSAPRISTKNTPKRRDELLDGGSLYWVFGNQILGRQRVVGVEEADNGRCVLVLDRELVPVAPTPKRAFQGWRYLETGDAPPDMKKRDQEENLPDDVRRALNAIGLM